VVSSVPLISAIYEREIKNQDLEQENENNENHRKRWNSEFTRELFKEEL